MAAMKDLLIRYCQAKCADELEQDKLQEDIMMGRIDISIEEMESYLKNEEGYEPGQPEVFGY